MSLETWELKALPAATSRGNDDMEGLGGVADYQPNIGKANYQPNIG